MVWYVCMHVRMYIGIIFTSVLPGGCYIYMFRPCLIERQVESSGQHLAMKDSRKADNSLMNEATIALLPTDKLVLFYWLIHNVFSLLKYCEHYIGSS